MYIALDLETTGFDAQLDQIIEIGIVKFNDKGEILDSFQSLINPQTDLPEIVTHITGIKEGDLKDAPTLDELRDKISEFTENFPIIGHNIIFDTTFLKAKGIPVNSEEFDTLFFSSAIIKNLSSYSLETISKKLKLTHVDTHRALDDAKASMELFIILKNEFQALAPELISEIQKLSEKSNFPSKNFFLNLKHSGTPQLEEIKTEIETADTETINFLKENKGSAIIETQDDFPKIINTLAQENRYTISLPKRLFDQIQIAKDSQAIKVDKFSNHISSTRLNKYLKRDSFIASEIQALIKILIWLDYTDTGLLSELNFFGEEKAILNKINETEKTNDDEIPKDKTIICSHDYLVEEELSPEQLIILDLETFSTSVRNHYSIFLTLENTLSPLTILKHQFPDNTVIESLISRSTIIFGVIGMFYQNNKNEKHGNRVVVRENLKDTKEWHDLKAGITSLIEVSQGLAEIMDKDSIVELKNWKENLKKLQQVFHGDSQNHTFIEETYTQEPIIKQFPLSLTETTEAILNKSKTIQIIDNCIDLNDDGIFLKKLHNIPFDLAFYSFPEKLKEISVSIVSEIEEHFAERMIKIIESEEKNLAIIINSKVLLKKFTLILSKNLKDISIISQTTGSIGKLTDLFKHAKNKAVLLLTPYAWQAFPLSEKIETLIIPKIPFLPPSDPVITMNDTKFSNTFSELTIPLATLQLRKTLNKLHTPNLDIKRAYLLDHRIENSGYGKQFLPPLHKKYSLDNQD